MINLAAQDKGILWPLVLLEGGSHTDLIQKPLITLGMQHKN